VTEAVNASAQDEEKGQAKPVWRISKENQQLESKDID
jgi:hypothetical protein